MSNTETTPTETRCEGGACSRDGAGHPVVEILTPREVPLGGPRAMTVLRTLPQAGRSLIGAWCFADHYGPDDITQTGGMDVAPHPHTGLQTVSWLFTGEIEHRDSHGVHAMVRPGELNLMTGGHGICHSEVSTAQTTTLHGVQLWVALPDESRDAARDFQHYAPEAVAVGGVRLRVFLGTLAGQASPVRTATPLLGAELLLEPRSMARFDVDPGFEHGLLVDTEAVELSGTRLSRGELGYVGTGVDQLTVLNPTDSIARAILLGGKPFGEQIVMWWNFVGRHHDEIAEFREAWQAESERFGHVEGYEGAVARLPAPPLPTVRMVPRRNPPTSNPES
ncbi:MULTISPECIES: pirin family protein [unclassified Mycobacterium]|uniref:pirin family protein n=1 Tax=unclassified Mycobacterium TaxID=2642494 RepID=UPI0009926C68|nr:MULTISPECIES: pirin family protein [unclassified Mycobacterium]